MPVLAGQAVVLRLLRVIIQKRILFSFSVFRVLVLTECFLSGKNLGNDLDLVIVFVILKLQVFASRVIRKIEKQLENQADSQRENRSCHQHDNVGFCTQNKGSGDIQKQVENGPDGNGRLPGVNRNQTPDNHDRQHHDNKGNQLHNDFLREQLLRHCLQNIQQV